MSQVPFPPGYPGQQPPPPPGGGYYGSPQMPPGEARRSNPVAITALVMGILLCIPFITGLGGIVCGIVGIRKAKDPRVGGRGMAIAGLALGLANLVLWGLLGGGILALISGTAEQRGMAKQFIQDLSDGKVAAAAAVCDPTLPKASLQQASAAMKTWGPLKDVTTFGINANKGMGGTQVVVAGAAQFGASTQRSFTIEFAKQNGVWRITKFDFPGP
ncbi:MAG: rane protein [Phycisphaerales bacterium]|nr:rane protein [Phycisphaerales bacterium]